VKAGFYLYLLCFIALSIGRQCNTIRCCL